MHAEFWQTRWANHQIGFHESQVNPLLTAYFDALALPAGARVFVPLCGMTLDIDWLLSRGHRVAGVELSVSAVEQLFERLGLVPTITRLGALERYSAAGLDIFAGDIFDLSTATLGAVDAVYDRAALIALPADMRRRYASHMHGFAHHAPQLLITLEYDQRLVDGPPFSVAAAELQELYPVHVLQLLSGNFMPEGLKGRFPVTESVWKMGLP